MCSAHVQVFTAATLTPSASSGIRGISAFTFSAALSGLGASTGYTYTLNRDDGAGVASCTQLGTTDAAGALSARLLALPAPVTYAVVGRKSPSLMVYHAADCPAGTSSANAVLMAYASSPVIVSSDPESAQTTSSALV